MITEEEWEDLKKEIDLITRDRKILKKMWISAAEGDNDNHLEKPAHWPDMEVFKNETKTLEAIETVWRDYYTGQRLKDYPKPFNRHIGNADTMLGETGNCMIVDNEQFWTDAWFETQCSSPPDHTRCPCSYPGQPLLRLRGLCSPLIDSLYSTKQLPQNPDNMLLLGVFATRIEFRDESRSWVMTSATSNVTGVSKGTKLS